MLAQMNLQNKILCASFGIFLILYYFLNDKPPVTKTTPPEEPVSADTYIPPGHVLVPIQIENSESLMAVMGAFAVVDLYSEVGGHSSLIAEKVKLIRAPLNPQQFAVLVSDHLSGQIMKVKTPFSVVLQNRNTFKANLEKNLLVPPEKSNSPANESQKLAAETSKSEVVRAKPTAHRKFEIEYYQRNRL